MERNVEALYGQARLGLARSLWQGMEMSGWVRQCAACNGEVRLLRSGKDRKGLECRG